MSDEYLNQFLKGLRDLAQGFEDASEADLKPEVASVTLRCTSQSFKAM